MRIDFTTFFKLVIKDLEPNFVMETYHLIYLLQLEKFFDEYIEKKNPILIIKTPPQHGKSLINSVFVAYCACELQSINMMYASYAEELVDRMNGRVRIICTNEFIIKLYSLKVLKATTKLISLNNSSIIQTCITGGAITGKSIDIGLIDDYHKDIETARSKTYQKKMQEWVSSIWGTRFDKQSGTIYCGTNFHTEDMLEFVSKKEKENNIVRFCEPAIAIFDSYWRKSGEALLPNFKPLEFLEKQKRGMTTHQWEAIYQQNPLDESGNVVDISKFCYYETLDSVRLVFSVITADTAMKKALHNDRSAFGLWGIDIKGNVYLIDSVFGRWDGQELLDTAIAFYDKHIKTKGFLGIMIEEAAGGSTIVDQLKARGKIAKGYLPEGSKVARVERILPYQEQGRVFLPSTAKWIGEYVREWKEFSWDDSHEHDDLIDMSTMGISILIKKLKFY